MLRDGQEVSIDAVPFDSTQRTYVTKDGVTYKIDDGTSVIYAGVSGIIKGYRIFFGVDGTQVEIEQGDSLTIKDNKYFGGVETVTTVYTTPTNDIDVTYNAIDIQRMNASLGSGFLEVKEDDISVSGMTVTIQPQRACIDGITVTAKEAVQIPIDNGLSQLRTDLIVLRKTQTNASADYFVKKGELGSTTPPELEQVAMGIYEVPICSIRVNANQTTLELSNIIDMRQTKDLGVSENVANSTMKRNALGQADVADPLDTNDEGIVNVGYAKEKAIEGYGQKTDCILKAGLDIDVEWDSEKTVVKQGTTLIKPNGDSLVISKDITSGILSTDGTWLMIADGGSYVHRYKTDTVFSSSVDPTGSVYTAWYNYETKIFYLRSGDTWAPKTSYSLPFAQVKVENGVFTDVQKLDSISYFGTTLFAIPETKILVASGRNEDGSLNSIEYTVSSLSQRNNVRQVTNQIVLDPYSGVYNSNTTYNYVLNRYYDNNALYRFCSVGKVTSANGVVITSIATKRPFFTADLQSGIYGYTNTLPASEIKELVDEGGTTLESHMENTNSAHGGMSDVATGGTLARRKTNGQLEFAKGTGTGNLGATMANIVDTLNAAKEDATTKSNAKVVNDSSSTATDKAISAKAIKQYIEQEIAKMINSRVPDYNNPTVSGLVVTNAAPYTVPVDGALFMFDRVDYDTFIGSTNIGIISDTISYPTYIPVKAGTVISASASLSSFKIYLCPWLEA